MKTSPGVPYFFVSWDPYRSLPPVPRDPTDYEHAEKLQAFCIFIFDKDNKVVTFEKWISNSTPKDPFIAHSIALSPGNHYFATSTRQPEQIGNSLSLDATKNRTEYYRICVNQNGTILACERINRERMFHHEYIYWDNGKLRECQYENSDNSTSSGFVKGIEHFDRNGKSIDEK